MKRNVYLLLPVLASTIALFWIVPEISIAHLNDPSYWGLIGYAATLVVVSARVLGLRSPASEHRWMVGFLVGMPLIYVADWLRFGGTTGWLGIELAGLVLYSGLAWLSIRRSPWFLPSGIAAHALWDAAHYDRVEFVPSWYALGCIVVDVALGLYVAGRLTGRWSVAGLDFSSPLRERTDNAVDPFTRKE